MSETKLVTVAELKEGDRIDLEGDALADPDGDRIEFADEFATVNAIRHEASGAIAIYWDNGGYCFPADHKVKRRA